MKKFTKILSLVLAAFFAFSVFTVNSEAARSDLYSHKRDLTAEEIQVIAKLFDAEQYAKMYPDVVAELGSDPTVLFNHFINYGIWELRQPAEEFEVNAYASLNGDLQVAYGDDIIAYYIYYIENPGQQAYRSPGTVYYAMWHNCTVYCVYDFVKGQQGAKAGATPLWTPGSYLQKLQDDAEWYATNS